MNLIHRTSCYIVNISGEACDDNMNKVKMPISQALTDCELFFL